MVDKKSLVSNLTVNRVFIGLKIMNLPSLKFLLRPQWAMETCVVGWIPIFVDYRGWPTREMGEDKGKGDLLAPERCDTACGAPDHVQGRANAICGGC